MRGVGVRRVRLVNGEIGDPVGLIAHGRGRWNATAGVSNPSATPASVG